jgi:Mn2+/Fe2+ NRAMP family transporter
LKDESPAQKRELISAIRADEEAAQSTPRGKFIQWLKTIGPGFLSGMAGNDATACTTYAIDGATVGYGHLWLMLLSTPMYQAVQFACARIGRVTQQGLSELLREHYSRGIALLAAIVLIIADLALVAGNLVAIGSGLQLITGVSWIWFVVPVAALFISTSPCVFSSSVIYME